MILPSLFLAAHAATAKADTEQRAALLVAVTHQPPGLPTLAYPARDVVAMAATLLEPQAAFDRVRIIADPLDIQAAIIEMLVDPAVSASRRDAIVRHQEAIVAGVDTRFQPTREGVLAAVTTFAKEDFARADRATALALVYLSGHGTVDAPPPGSTDPWKSSVRYFMTQDVDTTNVPATALPVADISEALHKVRSNHRLLINASCHSAAPGAKGSAALTLEADVEAEISAGSGVSYEDPLNKLDLYTFHFLEALTGGATEADTNRDGAVSDLEAHQAALRGVSAFNAALGEKEHQVPAINHRQIGPDDIVLAGRRGEPGRSRVYSASRSSRRLVLEARTKGAPTTTSALDQATIDLDAGCYQAQIREQDGRVRYRGPLCVGADPVPVERLVDRSESVAVSVGVGGFVPLDAGLESQLTAGGGMLAVTAAVPLSHEPPVGWVVDVSAVGAFGAGLESAFDANYPTTFTAAMALAGVRRLQRLPMGDLSVGLVGGGMAGVHHAALPESASGMEDYLLAAPVGGARVRLDFTPGYSWVIGAQVELLLTALEIDGLVAPRPLLATSLQLGRRW